jgi:hypothetical protein
MNRLPRSLRGPLRKTLRRLRRNVQPLVSSEWERLKRVSQKPWRQLQQRMRPTLYYDKTSAFNRAVLRRVPLLHEPYVPTPLWPGAHLQTVLANVRTHPTAERFFVWFFYVYSRTDAYTRTPARTDTAGHAAPQRALRSANYQAARRRSTSRYRSSDTKQANRKLIKTRTTTTTTNKLISIDFGAGLGLWPRTQ